MPAYLIVDTKITDPEAYENYKAQAKPLVEKYGGIYKVRGGELEVFEGDLWKPTRLVVIEFPSMEQARTFYHSPDYAPVKALRQGASVCSLALVDGV
ncbi:DUF1330 domain-containing protein [Limibacillus halophilus]|uniref:Uncharacterized protein (DUF1330 family) n=1 Tax=Limibacillus halophilus TaxID=1579333 RepID=A0A839SUD9_9PROT|nr:DUF1330 domain-containing protein [Limibacillus halophilus]MBB3065310.1 uncharacterized protein (DUF1330 family) [Limibacillus halophilus]